MNIRGRASRANSAGGATAMMARRGRIFVFLVLFAVVLVVLVLLGFLPQDILRRYVEKRLQTGLGAGSSIGRMHTVPGRLSTDVEDLVIQGPTYRLTVPKARVVLEPGFLFGKAPLLPVRCPRLAAARDHARDDGRLRRP